MSDWWNGLSLMQRVFAYLALPATAVLIVQTVMVLFGLGAGSDADADGDVSGGEMPDGLALFSIRGIVAFFSVGGWAGIALLERETELVWAIIGALVAGSAALYAVALLFRWAARLQSAGNVKLENAVGKTAQVYIAIPAGQAKAGKVTLTFQGRFSECDAMTSAGRLLKAGERVRVIGLVSENILLVEPFSETAAS